MSELCEAIERAHHATDSSPEVEVRKLISAEIPHLRLTRRSGVWVLRCDEATALCEKHKTRGWQLVLNADPALAWGRHAVSEKGSSPLIEGFRTRREVIEFFAAHCRRGGRVRMPIPKLPEPLRIAYGHNGVTLATLRYRQAARARRERRRER